MPVKQRPNRKLIHIREEDLSAPVNSFPSDNTHHLAFDKSFLPNIISIVADDKIIAINQAAAKLLGYSKKTLLHMQMADIFEPVDQNFKRMLLQRSRSGHAIENVSAKKKGGKCFPCQIISVEFTGENHIKKAISTLVDRREGIRNQKDIDVRREKQADTEMVLAQSKSDAILNRLVALEHKLDSEISAKEQLQSTADFKDIAFKNELANEIKGKENEIANAVTDAKELERTDLGMELHDNVNQLLVASRLYLEIARKNNAKREMYLDRSSEYIMTAIEEIRKLAKGLVNDAVKNLGFCASIEDMAHDIMEVHPMKIFCSMDAAVHTPVNAKFNLAVFRIVQEQLNNIIKHANASEVKIDLAQNKGHIVLSISDNGSGFDIKKKTPGIGIQNIKSRAESFQGNARFVSSPGKGCVLTVLFPVEKSKG